MPRYNNRRRRENLMKKDARCYWCKVEVVYFRLHKFAKMPDNFATLDHLNTRYFPEVRRATDPNISGKWIETTVLACHKCNQERADKETATIDKEELRRRAGAYPQGHPLNVDFSLKWK